MNLHKNYPKPSTNLCKPVHNLEKHRTTTEKTINTWDKLIQISCSLFFLSFSLFWPLSVDDRDSSKLHNWAGSVGHVAEQQAADDPVPSMILIIAKIHVNM